MTIDLLSDTELRERLRRFAVGERRLLAALLRHLAEADRRRASDGWGFRSLFAYCAEELRYSEACAYKRITAARTAAKYPLILELLERGETHLEAILILAPHLTKENASQVLERARGLGKRDVEVLAAELSPRPDSPDHIACVPCRAFDRVEPLSPGRVRFSFTGDSALREKLLRVRDLLRARYPEGRLEHVLDEMAEVFLDAKDPQRIALRRTLRRAKRARNSEPKQEVGRRTGRRAIPPQVRDAVWLRDGGRCAFVASDGRRCDARSNLEIDHVVPWSLGGRSDDPAGLRLLCRRHNQHAARAAFGLERVGPQRRGAARQRPALEGFDGGRPHATGPP